MVRPGLMAYGVAPPGERKANQKLIRLIRSALSFHSRVSNLKWISKGTSLGYVRTFTANQKMQIASIPSDYGNSYPPSAPNRANVLIRGQLCPVVGRVTMDQ
ncbi:hypothetical protein N9079_03155 [bacterium]|nr:hypothetical protein [bacterium]